MLRTNREKLVKLSVIGEIASPTIKNVYNISATGIPCVLPGVGGIAYNLRVGDFACGWEADHVEPCVSTTNKENDARSGNAANTAYNVLSCIGNKAIVASGDAKGEIGTVTGKHGGIEHVLIDFKPDILDKLLIGDKIQIRAYGTGLKLLDFPEIKIVNMDPYLLETMNLQTNDDDGEALVVPVTHVIPANIMGSGLGANHVNSGDYDIQLFDDSVVKQFGLENLRLGDIVAILDADHSYGRIYRKGAVSIGVVVHANCVTAGHGPGVTTLMTSTKGKFIPQINSKANLASLLKLRADI
ncbi:MAG: DUF4438 domain-containing protein [Nitrososphaerota archaeon]|jgi:hypothetical protein|nr:DUF4438 domain-containing protein [Nitrososphaerota archaeon]